MTVSDTRFAFQGGEVVRLLSDHPDSNLKAGDQGVIWEVYDLVRPLYEADFYRQDGSDTTEMFESKEVEIVDASQSIRIPQEALDFWKGFDAALPSAD